MLWPARVRPQHRLGRGRPGGGPRPRHGMRLARSPACMRGRTGDPRGTDSVRSPGDVATPCRRAPVRHGSSRTCTTGDGRPGRRDPAAALPGRPTGPAPWPAATHRERPAGSRSPLRGVDCPRRGRGLPNNSPRAAWEPRSGGVRPGGGQDGVGRHVGGRQMVPTVLTALQTGGMRSVTSVQRGDSPRVGAFTAPVAEGTCHLLETFSGRIRQSHAQRGQARDDVLGGTGNGETRLLDADGSAKPRPSRELPPRPIHSQRGDQSRDAERAERFVTRSHTEAQGSVKRPRVGEVKSGDAVEVAAVHGRTLARVEQNP
ncbi:hypothetical protein RKD49_007733 [Streptomyces glaucescens]